jgi:glycosyltransferase involved in cell wall biosynthesis
LSSSKPDDASIILARHVIAITLAQSGVQFDPKKTNVRVRDMFNASVIICAHNPRPEYLSRALDALCAQTLHKEQWELLLVDNASESPLAPTWDLSWHPNGRHLVEEEVGLASARRRAMKEALSDLLIFVDDDNVLCADYVARAIEIKNDWPILGVWGSGAIVPEFELQPTEYVRPLVPYLALREVATPFWSNVLPCIDATPWGAGLCARSNVAAAYCRSCEESLILITGRRGKVLLSGEDVELCYLACKIGLGIGIFPELKLTHLISKERVAEDYLIRLFEGTGISNLLLAYKWRGELPWSPLTGRGPLSLLKNLVLRSGIHRKMYLANVRAAIKARRIIKSAPGCIEHDPEKRAVGSRFF